MTTTAGSSPSGEDPRLAEARALSDSTRLRVLRAIEGSEEAVDVAFLTEVAQVHHTVVRDHLAKLVAAGLVEQQTAPPSGRGRPRLLYTLSTVRRRSSAQAGHYRRLALLLAETISSDEEPREVGRRAGLAAALEAAHDEGPAAFDALGVLVGESARMGFEPSVDRLDESHADIVLGHCPFGEVAAEEPETICALHAGIAEGIAEATEELSLLGVTVVDPLSAGCRFHLELTSTPVDAPSRRAGSPARQRR